MVPGSVPAVVQNYHRLILIRISLTA